MKMMMMHYIQKVMWIDYIYHKKVAEKNDFLAASIATE